MSISGNYETVARNLRQRPDRGNGERDVFWHVRVLNILSCCFDGCATEHSIDSAVAVIMEDRNRPNELSAGTSILSRRIHKSLHALLMKSINDRKKATRAKIVEKKKRKLNQDSAFLSGLMGLSN